LKATSIALVLLVFNLLSASSARATGAYIRVSQIGYETGLPMRAYLMSSSAASGVVYVIKNASGSKVASGAVGAKLGTWGIYNVYPIDFQLATPNRYTIATRGSVSATSPSFPVNTPANLYGGLLANSLYFFENERDGPNFISSSLRTAAGHLDDASAVVYNTPKFDSSDLIIGKLTPTPGLLPINAQGGWWDAGDFLKFVETHSYAVALMLIGIRDFSHQMGRLSTTSDFTNEALFGLRWLQQMWNDSTRTLYYHVGIGTDFESYSYLSDHDLWRLPRARILL
jgi:endoglucanase